MSFPENAYQPWTRGELDQLWAMINGGTPWNEIAKTLQRSITAVYSRGKMLRFADFALWPDLGESSTLKDFRDGLNLTPMKKTEKNQF